MGYGIRTHLKGYGLYRYLRRDVDYRTVLDRSQPLLRYIGWLGHRNVGDEVLYEAFRDELFRSCLVTPYYDFSPLSVAATLKPRKAVVLGGGTLINDDNYLIPLERAQRAGLPTFAFGTGVGDLSYWDKYPSANRGNAKRWIAALKAARYVGVRGPRSQRWLREHGIDAEILGDAALSIDYPQAKAPDEQGAIVGVNLGSHDPVSGDANGLFEAATRLVTHALRKGYRVRYVSMHAIDHDIGLRLQTRIADPGFRLEPLAHDTGTLLRQLAQCSLIVGQRLHTTVLACGLGIPNLSLSYQPKCLDFLESMECQHLGVPTEGITGAALVERFDWLAASADATSASIRKARDAFRAKQKLRASETIAACAAG